MHDHDADSLELNLFFSWELQGVSWENKKVMHFLYRNYTSVKPETWAAKRPHQYFLHANFEYKLQGYPMHDNPED